MFYLNLIFEKTIFGAVWVVLYPQRHSLILHFLHKLDKSGIISSWIARTLIQSYKNKAPTIIISYFFKTITPNIFRNIPFYNKYEPWYDQKIGTSAPLQVLYFILNLVISSYFSNCSTSLDSSTTLPLTIVCVTTFTIFLVLTSGSSVIHLSQQ